MVVNGLSLVYADLITVFCPKLGESDRFLSFCSLSGSTHEQLGTPSLPFNDQASP